MKKIAAAVLSLSGLLLAGCFDIEQTLTLEKDMSGKAGYSMKFDMEPMVAFMAGIKKNMMEGKEGPPTAEEIAAVRQEMLASRQAQTKVPTKEEIAKDLPKGVTLLDSKIEEDGLKFGMNMLFGFDHVSKLKEIDIKKPDAGAPAEAAAPAPGPGAGGPNPMESPFGGLQFVDEGATFLVTTPASNPLAEQTEQAEQMELSPEERKQVEDMFGNLRVAFKITSPLKVVEHNAHRKEGNTLVWEYDLESFEKMKPEELAKGVRVRYKK